MRWITRENIKVDRVACPWLIKRFVDQDAEFLFVPEGELLAAAKREDAIPFDATRFTEVVLNHRGDRCTFEAILEDFHLSDPALLRLGQIVRAADPFDLAAQLHGRHVRRSWGVEAVGERAERLGEGLGDWLRHLPARPDDRQGRT